VEGLVMALIIGSFVILGVLVALAAVRISSLASWRSLATIAVATGSFRACVAFLQYCERL
jgi:hypothetical protein